MPTRVFLALTLALWTRLRWCMEKFKEQCVAALIGGLWNIAHGEDVNMAGSKIPLPSESPTEVEVEAFIDTHLKKHHVQIGRIASVWAMMEFRMDQLIWHLLGIEQTLGACVTTQLNGTGPRLRTLKAPIEFLGSSPEMIKRLNKFSGEIIEPQEARNRAVHDPWFVGTKTLQVSQIRKAAISNKIVYEQFPVTEADLKKVYQASKEALIRFDALRDEILSEPLSALRGRRRKKLWRAGLP